MRRVHLQRLAREARLRFAIKVLGIFFFMQLDNSVLFSGHLIGIVAQGSLPLCVLPLSSTSSRTRNYGDRVRLSEYTDAIMKKKKKGLAASLLPPKVVSVLFLFYWKNLKCTGLVFPGSATAVLASIC